MAQRNSPTELSGPFHVGSRCINKEWFNLPMETVWQIFSEQLYFAKHAFQLEIHSFVLMSNHYHLIVSAPLCNLSEAMTYFSREVSRVLNKEGNRINRTFATRFHRSYISNYHYFIHCYKYVYQNPLRSGLCLRAEDYRFSTLHGKLGSSHMLIPVCTDTLLFEGNLEEHLVWLNTLPDQGDLKSIQAGLRRPTFSLRKDPKSKLRNRLEWDYF